MEIINFTPELEKEIYGDANPWDEEGRAIFKRWIENSSSLYEGGVFFYSATRDDFDLHRAINFAETCGYGAILVEDLS